jgi:hypothetical protein
MVNANLIDAYHVKGYYPGILGQAASGERHIQI